MKLLPCASNTMANLGQRGANLILQDGDDTPGQQALIGRSEVGRCFRGETKPEYRMGPPSYKWVYKPE